MVRWHHQLHGHEFEQALGNGEGQGGLSCCSPWGHKESTWLRDWITKAKDAQFAECPSDHYGEAPSTVTSRHPCTGGARSPHGLPVNWREGPWVWGLDWGQGLYLGGNRHSLGDGRRQPTSLRTKSAAVGLETWKEESCPGLLLGFSPALSPLDIW